MLHLRLKSVILLNYRNGFLLDYPDISDISSSDFLVYSKEISKYNVMSPKL